MTPILESAALGNDLDCQNFDLKNIGGMYPVPPGLVDINDPRLYDPRTPPLASVTNESVAEAADIAQSKLSLNGLIPAVWLTDGVVFISGLDQAARGDRAEKLANKGVPGGYASVDSGAKLLASHVTAGGGGGTVNSIGLMMPSVFGVTGSPITSGAGTFAVTWNNIPNNSWLGINGAQSFFSTQIPIELVPLLPATKFTTGKLDLEQLPAAIGMGTGHAKGITPDPGAAGDTGDYLGRDMKWHAFNAGRTYQPIAPKPGITLLSWEEGFGTVGITSTLPGSVLFYRVSNPVSIGILVVNFVEAHSGSISLKVTDGFFVEAYVAKEGYTNSEINSYTVITPF